MEAVNYPIKYTFMPIIEENEIKAYIAIKCYEVDAPITIENNGLIKTMYKVVPFYSYNLTRQYPKYLSDGKCYNYILTKMVFDELQDAIRYSRVLNQVKILHSPNQLFTKYYNIENDLLNKNNTNEANNIIDFNEIRLRTKRRVKDERILFNRI